MATPNNDSNEENRRVKPGDMPAAMGGIFQFSFRHYVSQCLYTFVKIGAADAIAGDRLSPAAIAAKLDMPVNVGYLGRMLRLLACEGVVTEEASDGEHGALVGMYGLTDLGKLLQTNVPQQPGLSGILEYGMHPAIWTSWCMLHESFVAPTDKGGDAGKAIPFEMAHGAKYFDFLKVNPDVHQPFSEAMSVFTMSELPAVLAYDWSQLDGKTIVDLGGSFGVVMEKVANEHPGVGKLISLDTEEVINMAPKPKNDKVELVTGDFFDSSSIPKCDAIFMKHILHDWNDADCQKILKACHEALNVGGRLIIADAVTSAIGDVSPATIPAKCLDIMMMVMVGALERSAPEWQRLLCGDGLFAMGSITPTATIVNIIECFKVESVG